MNIRETLTRPILGLVLVTALASCGGGDGPAIEARPQTLTLSPAPAALAVGASTTVSASASSGLPVGYSSATPRVCSVDAASGVVKALAAGTCTVNANQSGNATYAAAPQRGWAITITGGGTPPPEPGPAPAGSTRYQVVLTFYEPDTQPRNTVFSGTFSIDANGAVTGLAGTLTESMTGDPLAPAPDHGMSKLTLGNQLSVLPAPALGGVLVTTFLHNTTNTLKVSNGSDGWSPGTGQGLHYNHPGANPGNAYARIFVNPQDPTAPFTPAQINMLAYADCTQEGMMGATCMTGTSTAGYGSVGTMSGYPLSQVITRLP